MLAGRYPVPLGGGVNLEYMGPGAEDRLLPGGGNTEMMMMRHCKSMFLYKERKSKWNSLHVGRSLGFEGSEYNGVTFELIHSFH